VKYIKRHGVHPVKQITPLFKKKLERHGKIGSGFLYKRLLLTLVSV